MSRETLPPTPSHRESGTVKVLAVLLLIVSAALVFTAIQQRRTQVPVRSYEPRPIAQRPDDKLGADEQATIDVFSKFSRSVVHVTTLAVRRDRMTLDMAEIPQGVGSGLVWDQDGHIVTNFHVIKDVNKSDRVTVTLNDGTTYAAKIVGVAPDKDLAVLQIDALPQKLLPLPVGESASLKVGQKVLAIGNPFGLDQTLTTGVISGLGRQIMSVTQRPISDVIQTDASINPGNSGGPLLDSAGRLIGINTAIYSPSGANAGVGFAVPVDTVNAIVPQLIKSGRITRPGLGIDPLPDQVAMQYRIDGIVLRAEQEDGAAARAGIVPAHNTAGGVDLGDVIVGVDHVDIHHLTDLYKVLDTHKVGDEVEVAVVNNGRKRTVKVTLQPLP